MRHKSKLSNCITCFKFKVIILILPLATFSIPYKIPIGAILDRYSFSNDVIALKHALTIYNAKDTSFKFVAKIRIVDSHDPYNLTVSLCQLLKDGVFTVHIGLLDSQYSRPIIQSFLSHLHVPTFESKMSPPLFDKTFELGLGTTYQRDYVFSLFPSTVKAIAALILHYKWDRFIYLYEDDDGLERFKQLKERYLFTFAKKLNPESVFIPASSIYSPFMNQSGIVLKRLSPNNEAQVKSVLREIIMDPTIRHRIVLDYRYDRLVLLMEAICQHGMNKARYHYLFVHMDIDIIDLSEFMGSGANVSGFAFRYTEDMKNPEYVNSPQNLKEFKILDKKMPSNYTLTGQGIALMDGVFGLSAGINTLMSQKTDAFWDAFKRGLIYNNGSRGVTCLDVNDWSTSHYDNLVKPWQYGPEILNFTRNVKIKSLSGNIAFDATGERTDFQLGLTELTLNRGLTKVGSWTPTQGLKFHLPKFNRYTGNVSYNNRTRIITSIIEEPYFMEKVPKKDEILIGNDLYEGFCLELADMISKMVGFNYIIRPVKDGKYGAVDDNNQWNGVVGELIRHEADLAVAPLTITSTRERVIDFSKPFMDLGISIMIKKPSQQSTGVFSFLNPLSNSIWTCIIFGYIGVSVVLYLVSRFNPDEWKLQDSSVFTNEFTLPNCFWFVLGAFMQQGCDINPRSVSGRLTASVWWFFTLILISSYTANLAAFLTVERMNTPINSADDLAKQTEIKYGTLDAGSTKAFFHTSKVSVYEKMWQFMSTQKPSVFVRTTQEGVDRVRNAKGKYAYLLESTTNDYISNRNPCDTIKVGENLDSKGYGVATPLDSDLREAITFAVLKLREDGDLQRLKNKWWYDKGECGSNTGSNDISKNELTLSNVAGIFYILIGGLLVSLLMAFLEFVFRSRQRLKRAKTRKPTLNDVTLNNDTSFTSTEHSSVQSNYRNWFRIQV